jgi:hypothetical protein
VRRGEARWGRERAARPSTRRVPHVAPDLEMWRGHAPCGAGAAVPRDGSQSHTSRPDSLPPVVAGLRTRLDLDEDPPPYRNTPARIRPGINPGATSNKPAEAGWRGPPSNVAREMLSFLEESASESGCARLGVRNGSVHARGTVARCDQSRNRSWPCQLRHQHECRPPTLDMSITTQPRVVAPLCS